MADANRQSRVRGIISDLLVQDHLTSAEVKILQSGLNEYHKGGVQIYKLTGNMARETCNAAIGFLRDNKRLLPHLGDAIREAIVQEGMDHLITLLPKNPAQRGVASKESLDQILTQEYPLTEGQMHRLQTIFGFAGTTDGIEQETAKKIIDHLDNHPDMMGRLNFSILRQLTEKLVSTEDAYVRNRSDTPYNSRESLAAACRKSETYVARVESLIKETAKLSPVSVSPAIYELQVLLKAGGFGVEHPDGGVGPETERAINAFKEEMHPGSELQKAWKQGTSPVQKAEAQPVLPAVPSAPKTMLTPATLG
jgi:hypothetical protein